MSCQTLSMSLQNACAMPDTLAIQHICTALSLTFDMATMENWSEITWAVVGLAADCREAAKDGASVCVIWVCREMCMTLCSGRGCTKP